MDSGAATEIMIMAIILSVILLFLGVGVSILIHICIVGRAFRRGLIINNVSVVDQRGITTIGRTTTSMSQEDLEKLPSYEYESKGQVEGSASPVPDCAVCLENFEVGDKCRLLPTCNHSFHAHCVDAWLMKTPICPICRSSADSRGPEPIPSGDSSHVGDNFATSIDMRAVSYINENSHFNDDSTEFRDSLQRRDSTNDIDTDQQLRQSQGGMVELIN